MTIQAMIFDLDGTLVQTEKLKAYSYALAIHELDPQGFKEEEVIEAFKAYIGLPRREVSCGLLDQFGLEGAARLRMAEFGVFTPWQAFSQIRLRYFEGMITDPQVIRANTWPHNLALLAQARNLGLKIGLATMSYWTRARQILEILELKGTFDFIASRDDVAKPKPNPEIYLLVANELGVLPNECLVIEDSAVGIRAALSARMYCIAVTTSFTRAAVQAARLLDERWIIDNPADLPNAIEQILIPWTSDKHYLV